MDTMLSQLRVGEQATVRALAVAEPMGCRLRDLGLVVGTKVRCELRGPGGEICAYRFRGACVALRRDDARRVLVTVA